MLGRRIAWQAGGSHELTTRWVQWSVVDGWALVLGNRLAVWCSFGTQLAGLLLIMRDPSYTSLAVGSIVFGFGMGGVIPLQGAIIGATFGRLSFGTVLGLLRPVTMPVQMLGIPLAGWIYDTRGSYDLAFQVFVVTYVAAIGLIGALQLGQRPGWSTTPPSASQGETQLAS